MKAFTQLRVGDRPVRHVDHLPRPGKVHGAHHVVRQATCPTVNECPYCGRLVVRSAGRWWE